MNTRIPGTSYTLRTALRHMFTHGTAKDSAELVRVLEESYGGTATLYYKGRSALAEAVRLASNGSGGEIAISGLTCYSVVQAVEAAGCTPVFVDINEIDMNFGAKELTKTFRHHRNIKAVIVQNMLGLPADIHAIQTIAQDAGAMLIEDLAHSAGAIYNDGRSVGAVGDITMLSFGREKAIDTVNGGAIVVRNTTINTAPVDPVTKVRPLDQLRDRIFPLISWTRSLLPARIGLYAMSAAVKLKLVIRSADGDVNTNLSLPNWQAKLARTQLNQLSATTAHRSAILQRYREVLTPSLPETLSRPEIAPIRMPLLVKNRNEVMTHLRARGVRLGEPWYDVPVSPRRLYTKVDYDESACPVAVRVASNIINLPTHARITDKHANHISCLVNEVAQQ